MKKLFILLFSLFLLNSSSVFADDISDFQIEGISIGDSLLDYLTEDEILKELEISIKSNDNFNLKEPFKYLDVYLYDDLSNYDYIAILVKNNNLVNKYLTNKYEKYEIQTIRGMIDYIGDLDSCILKRDSIAKDLSLTYPDVKKVEKSFFLKSDPSGKSIKYEINLIFDSGDKIEVSCDDYEESFRIKHNWGEGLNIILMTSDVYNWAIDFN